MTQTKLFDGRCSHLDTEEVKTFGGVTIAIQCKGCATVLSHVGKCDGCGHVKKLIKLVQATRKRFCGDDCHQNVLKAKRKNVP